MAIAKLLIILRAILREKLVLIIMSMKETAKTAPLTDSLNTAKKENAKIVQQIGLMEKKVKEEVLIVLEIKKVRVKKQMCMIQGKIRVVIQENM